MGRFGSVDFILAAGLRRWGKSPARTFSRLAGALAALSLLAPATAAHTATATKITLAVAHVVVALVVIPVVTRALPSRA